MDGMLKKMKMKIFIYLKEFKFENFINAQNFVNKVGKLLKQKGIIQIYGLVGDMQKLKYLLML